MATLPNYQAIGAEAGQVFQGIGGLVSDLGAAAGAQASVGQYDNAAAMYGEAASQAGVNAYQAQANYKIQDIQNQRQVYQVGGAGIATAAANGLKESGSALNIFASTQRQGALARQLITQQGMTNVEGYLQQQQSDIFQQQQDLAAAQAAKSTSFFAKIGAVLSGSQALAGAAMIATMI